MERSLLRARNHEGHHQIDELRRREQRLAAIVIDAIVVVFMPAFTVLSILSGHWIAVGLGILAWVLDLIGLILAVKGNRVAVSRTLTLIAMNVIVAFLFVEPVVNGYGFMMLLLVPPALLFIARYTYAAVMNGVYALLFALAVFELLPAPWTIPAEPAVQFTFVATYAMVGVITYMLQRARGESYRTLTWLATHDTGTGFATSDALDGDGVVEPGAALLVSLRDPEALGARYGFQVMAQVRQAIADRIRALTDTESSVYQFGDTNTLLLLSGKDDRQARALGTRLVNAITEEVDAGELVVTPAVNIAAELHSDESPLDEVLRRLLLTLPVSYARGMNALTWFERAIEEQHVDQVQLGDRLVRAIEDDALTVAYQPIVPTDPTVPADAEILVRWRDDAFGDVPPSRFVRLAEERGLIEALTESVIRTSWREMGPHFEGGSIGRLWLNLSPVHMRSDNFADGFRDMFENNSVRRACYSVELTEGALIDERVLATGILDGLRDAGFRIAIDDFGTGYSNLDYLRRFAVDRLKIDRSFVSGGRSNERQAMIVRGILSLARSLELKTVAEGVETDADCAWVREMGVDACQGYFSGMPMNASELESYLEKPRN